MPSPFTIRPTFPPDLRKTIDGHMALFEGFQMMADAANPPAGGTGTDTGGGTQPDGAKKDAKSDEELGEKGLKALQKERDARSALEKEVAALKAFQGQFTDMVATLSGKPAAATAEDAVKQLTDQVAALTHGNLVERVAREHGITDAADVTLLSAMQTEDAIRNLAARLKPTDDGKGGDKKDANGKKATRPKPDPSAGAGGGDTSAKPTSVAQVMADRRAAREAASKK